jgi:hypothetical protein
MDKEFLVGCLCALTFAVSVVAGITVNNIVNMNDQLRYEQICQSQHKGVSYREVDGSLVSECR